MIESERVADLDLSSDLIAHTVPLADIRRTRNIAAKVQVRTNPNPVVTMHDFALDDTRSMVFDDSDNDPDVVARKCRLKGCKKDTFSACFEYLALLCYDHFVEDVNTH